MVPQVDTSAGGDGLKEACPGLACCPLHAFATISWSQRVVGHPESISRFIFHGGEF
jgi:hypothetical protein